MPPASLQPNTDPPRHAAFVRVTHWVTAIAFLALLVTGAEIVLSHPRFYWGETGNSGTQPWLNLHLPSSRDTVPSGYPYVLPDQNGWSRYLHFESAWVAVITALIYGIAGLWTGHFRRNLLPARGTFSWQALKAAFAKNFRGRDPADAHSYNVLQRIAYAGVVFVLFPGVIWTGLALSPAFNSAFPFFVDVLGGRQSARTLHFLISCALLLFFLVHVAMVIRAGFFSRMRAMITGGMAASTVCEPNPEPERTLEHI